MPDDHGRFALTQFAQRLNSLYARDQAWTERVVIASIDREGQVERDAALAGFFSILKVSGELFLRLKPILIRLATPEECPLRLEAVLSDLFITAWHAKNHEGMRYLE